MSGYLSKAAGALSDTYYLTIWNNGRIEHKPDD
jgi:hypothetical protein